MILQHPGLHPHSVWPLGERFARIGGGRRPKRRPQSELASSSRVVDRGQAKTGRVFAGRLPTRLLHIGWLKQSGVAYLRPGDRVLDRIVCLVDGSPDSFDSLGQARMLSPPWGRIVAVTPLDLAAATRARCQVGTLASAWDAQAQLIQRRATETLGEAGGDARIIEGNRVSALVRAAREEDATMIAIGAATLQRGELRKLLRRASGSILVTRPMPSTTTTGVILMLVEDDLKQLAEELGTRLCRAVRAVANARPAAARQVTTHSRPGDLVLIRATSRPRRFARPVELGVAARAAASVMIVRGFESTDILPPGRTKAASSRQEADQRLAAAPSAVPAAKETVTSRGPRRDVGQ